MMKLLINYNSITWPELTILKTQTRSNEKGKKKENTLSSSFYAHSLYLTYFFVQLPPHYEWKYDQNEQKVFKWL